MRNRRRRLDLGEATAQVVILTPILILLVFLGIQAAIYFHSANVAAAAASQGAAAGSRRGAGIAQATAAAQQTLAELGDSGDAETVAEQDAAFVRVTVQIDVPRLLPFFPETVSRTAVEPNERFVPESER